MVEPSLCHKTATASATARLWVLKLAMWYGTAQKSGLTPAHKPTLCSCKAVVKHLMVCRKAVEVMHASRTKLEPIGRSYRSRGEEKDHGRSMIRGDLKHDAEMSERQGPALGWSARQGIMLLLLLSQHLWSYWEGTVPGFPGTWCIPPWQMSGVELAS